ncbi:MAG: UDP-N-acetylmuramoyl-tripeptide--D-alanyl-D-alanine ligase [Deferribacteraceae bacterium]|jgi:UDP-N-acetylmuramoyl-tripeptide--D-alanyl-D-alanine ligase|nr:UDP-N-acetylmuramoyl-tripeptide--D-alanyl-D-alanine ligase [Deferribacteraceae bacterium]
MTDFTEYFDGLLDIKYDGASVSGAEIDSRRVENGNIFFACKGKNADGNRFAQDAVDKGAAIVVMDDPGLYAAVTGNKALVNDSQSALLSMGAKKLATTSAIKIAVTGSYGKTSTKEMLKLVLSKKYKTYATKGNYNNSLGVSLTACGIDDDAEAAVFELGSNGIGEISALSAFVSPQIAVITGLGYAHVGKFGSIEAVAREKLSVADGLSESGVMVVHEVFKDDIARKYVKMLKRFVTFGRTDSADIRILDCIAAGNKLVFTISTADGEYPCTLNYLYPHIAENFLAAVAVGRLLSIPYDAITPALAEYTLPSGRGDVIEAGSFTIINDCYNASLEAVERAIDGLGLLGISPKYALIGEIGEIDGYEDFVYGRLMDKTKEYPDIRFIFSGVSYSNYKQTVNVIIAPFEDDTNRCLDKIDKGVVLIKASRMYGFEKYKNLLLSKTRSKNAV